MLGQLLEFSVSAPPVGAALAGYLSLGLTSIPVRDVAAGPRAVVADTSVALGLYDTELEGPAPTFVRPGLKEHVRSLRRCGVEFDFLELADDQFHRAGFRDPNGLAIVLIEARTFSPFEAGRGLVPACGSFAELSVATPSLAESLAFWGGLGFSSVPGPPTPHPSARLRAQGLTLGLHETARFKSALTFRAGNLDGRVEYLRAKGFRLRRGSALTASDQASATLLAPGGVEFFLVGAEADEAVPAPSSDGR